MKNPKYKQIKATRGFKWSKTAGTKFPTRLSFKSYDQIGFPKGERISNKELLSEVRSIMYGTESAVNWTPLARKKLMALYRKRLLKKKIKSLKKPPYNVKIGRGEIIRTPLTRKK